MNLDRAILWFYPWGVIPNFQDPGQGPPGAPQADVVFAMYKTYFIGAPLLTAACPAGRKREATDAGSGGTSRFQRLPEI